MVFCEASGNIWSVTAASALYDRESRQAVRSVAGDDWSTLPRKRANDTEISITTDFGTKYRRFGQALPKRRFLDR
jgi:hypothetical protein